MPPKRRDRDSAEGGGGGGGVSGSVGGGSTKISSNTTMELIPTDHEIFLQAYEKPTQIYRFLRTRNMYAPVYLYRNLTYMKHRSTRTNKARANFKVNSLLAGIEKSIPARLGDYMTLMFLGYFDKGVTDTDVVEVDTYLSKISHKKRKDSFKAQQERVATSVVKINPDDAAMCSSKIPAVSVPTDDFKPVDGSQNTSYQLRITVRVASNFMAISCMNNDEEPSAKRLKTNGFVVYESDLVVFDKQSRCLLFDGEYELPLHESFAASAKSKAFSPKKQTTWERYEIVSLDKQTYDSFQKLPVLKFRLAWTKERCADFVDRPLPITIKKQQDQIMTTQSLLGTAMTKTTTDQNHNGTADQMSMADDTTKVAVDGGGGVDYCFIYNNNTRQQTQACDLYTCPWCKLNCVALYTLLKHLKLCHARFSFTYVPSSGPRSRIDVCINELYDGSYTGSPHDLVSPSGCAFSRAGPVRRTVVTRILVCRPRRKKPSLSEFLEVDENELNSQRPYITGHNRLYYHAMTWLPAQPKELDDDSEDETGPPWLQHKTQMMIDDFTDVNEGEKEIMKMWNIHTMRNGYVGDIQIPLACGMYIDQMGRELLKKNLYKNFVLHLCHLSDNGLVTPEVHHKTIQKLQRLLSTESDALDVMIAVHRQQLYNWRTFGRAKQKQLLLLKNENASDSKAGLKDAHYGSGGGIKSKDDNKSLKRDGKPSRLLPKRKESGGGGSGCATKTAAMGVVQTPTPPLPLPPPKKIASNEMGTTKRTSSMVLQQPPAPANGKDPVNESSELKSRRSLNLRKTPPKRRSSGSSTIQPSTAASATAATTTNTAKKIPPNRRNSIASVSSMSNRKRMSLTLTKLDK